MLPRMEDGPRRAFSSLEDQAHALEKEAEVNEEPRNEAACWLDQQLTGYQSCSLLLADCTSVWNHIIWLSCRTHNFRRISTRLVDLIQKLTTWIKRQTEMMECGWKVFTSKNICLQGSRSNKSYIGTDILLIPGATSPESSLKLQTSTVYSIMPVLEHLHWTLLIHTEVTSPRIPREQSCRVATELCVGREGHVTTGIEGGGDNP